MQKSKHFLLLIIVLLATAVPRLMALDRVVTVDEMYWVRRSANVHYALAHRDFADTYQKYHPGVVTQTLGAISMLVSFPDYRIVAPGQMDVNRYQLFHDVARQAGRSELDILVAGRVAVILAITAILGLCFLAARRLVGDWPALAGILLASFDPYYLGHSRLLQTEAVMSALLLLSVLLLVDYLRRPNLLTLAAAGVSAGAACLAKAPGVIMLPYMALILAAGACQVWRTKDGSERALWPLIMQRWLKPLLIGLLVLALTYVLLWPAMWVQPLKTLDRIYGHALNYSDIELEDVGDEELLPDEANGYIQSLLWRTTPLTWLGLLLGLLWWLSNWEQKSAHAALTWLAVFAVAFLAMMAISAGGGKQAPHYILAVHLTLSAMAGMGAALLLASLPKTWLAGILTAIIGLQLWSSATYAPYYFNYYNPLMGTPGQGVEAVGVGYGEVLEQAAAYLAAKPDAENTTVYAWYGEGSFSYYYPGPVINLPPGDSWGRPKIKWLGQSDYLVMYYAQQVRRHQPGTLVETLQDVEPEHSIWLHGIEYVRIYRTGDLPESLYTPDP